MSGPYPLCRLTAHVPQDLGERLLNAAAARGRSAAELLQHATRDQVEQPEQTYNRGQPFPERRKVRSS